MQLRASLSLLMTCALTACVAHKPTHAPAAPVSSAATSLPTPKPAARKSRTPEIVHKPKQQSLASRDVGYYFDVLQGRLQQQLDPAVIIARDRAGIVLDFSRRLGFASDAVQLDAADHEVLAPLAKILVEYRAVLVSVRTSAEDDGGSARKLAQRRADAIARILMDAGVASARIVGEVPKAPAHDGVAHVEIALVPETRSD